jgi:hypothetical protein
MKYTWGRGWSAPTAELRTDWQVLLSEEETSDHKPFGKQFVVLGGIKNEYIARAVSVLLNADDES